MMERNLFEIASRRKFRWQTDKGPQSVEELWKMSTTKLDALYRDLSAELKASKGESLLETKNIENQDLEDRIEIIKYIVKVKLAEIKEAENAKERKEEKQEILQIIKEKESEAKRNMSVEELKKLAENL